MRTIVIAGARSNVGKTTLARQIRDLLPGSVRVKIGHHALRPHPEDGYYYPMGTRAADIREKHAGCAYVIIESNTILHELKPELCIYLGADEPKPSAAHARAVADLRRDEPCEPGLIDTLNARLAIDSAIMRHIAWLAGSRPRRAAAVILAGGESRRMGTDKAFLDIQGKTMVRATYDTLRPLFDEVHVSVAKSDARYGDLPVAEDHHPGMGPLGGFEAARAKSEAEVFFVIACDIPRFDIGLIRRLLAFSEHFHAVAPAFGPRLPEPLFAVYRAEAMTAAARLLASGERRASRLLQAVSAHTLRLPENQAYMNVNTPSEYAACISGETAHPG
jgi:molybdenum cofactor guanylyltransferase